jgi:hypothetical protein
MRRKDIELRDHYAGLAMQAIIMGYSTAHGYEKRIADNAFAVANAMMEARLQDIDDEV